MPWKKFLFRYRFRYTKDKIIPIVLIIGGVFLILAFTPVWMWLFLLGIFLVFSGIHVLKIWR